MQRQDLDVAAQQSHTASEAVQVSVAMCTYNGAQYLGEQLESIARQTLQPFELVVCDDGSSDGTVAMLEAYAKGVCFTVRIFVNATNLGTTRNFEKALRLCTGEFVALCDQDDTWVDTKLEVLAGMLQGDPRALGAFSDAAIVDAASKVQEGSLWQRFRFGARKQASFRRDPITLLLKHDIVTGATLMVRRSVMDLFAEIPTCWLQDGWLTWMIALEGRMLLTPERLTRYRLHAAQQVGTGSMTLSERVKSVRTTERERYRKMVRQSEAVMAYIAQRRLQAAGMTESSQDAAGKLARKAAFLSERAAIPSGLAGKLWFLAANVGNYERYARGVRSMRKDLVL